MVREGSRVFQDARDEDAQARAEGAAFLVSAWEDANTFIAEAPPDTRHMLGMLGWYVLLTVVVRGPELSADLRELDVSYYKHERISWRRGGVLRLPPGCFRRVWFF